LSVSEAKAADDAFEKLRNSLNTAKSAIQNDKKEKDRTAVFALIKKWLKEIKSEREGPAGAIGYTVKLAKVQELSDKKYAEVVLKIDTAHSAARRHINDGTVPPDKDLHKLLEVARDGGKICSPTYYKEMDLPEGKLVKPGDIVLPKDMNANLTNIKELA
jgi:hypothetical protein